MATPSAKAMSLLDRSTFFVKEHFGVIKLTDTFDILDPETHQKVVHAQETPAGWAKWLRLIVAKTMLPSEVTVWAGPDESAPVAFRMRKRWTFWRAKVRVEDGDGTELGFFRAKIFSLGGGFWVHDMQGNQIAEVKGDWKGWNFTFRAQDGKELGSVTRKWGGLAKEIFTSADTYAVTIADHVKDTKVAKVLLLAAALAIDTVFKERQGSAVQDWT